MNQPGTDFPFYNGDPVRFSAGQWAGLLLAVAVGFAALYLPPPPESWGMPEGLADGARVLLFRLIPLLALRAVAGPHGWALFRRVGVQDVFFALGIALLNILVTVMVALLVTRVFGANANPAIKLLAEASTQGRLVFFLQSIPQLLGEELVTMIPFLALLALLSGPAGLPRRQAIIGAWLASALLFGLLHLPTYQWNVVQCLLVIGSARLVLSLAYLRTRNLWVSTLAHVINDWLLFGLAIVLGGLLATQGPSA